MCVEADEGDDFANNLFSDLSPLLALFGERVTMQFMSESMGWADNIILAMAPLGRAKENLAAAEVELMSSTSDEVCELWNGRKIVRCMGSAPVVEFICLMPKDKSKNVLGIETTELETVFNEISIDVPLTRDGNSKTSEADPESTIGPTQSQSRTVNETSKDTSHMISITRNKDNGSPNVSLNIHSHSSTFELVLAAVTGTILQFGVLVYAGVSVYYPSLSLKLTRDNKLIATYAYPCTIAGTLLLALGIALCAHVVESSTKEKTFRAKDKREIRVIWLQQQKTVSDQVFKSCAIYAKNARQSIKSSRRYERHENECTLRELLHEILLCWTDEITSYGWDIGQIRHGLSRLWRRLRGKSYRSQSYETQHQLQNSEAQDQKQNNTAQVAKHHMILSIKTVLGAAITLTGFIVQFVGLRGMHWSISIAQLGAVLLMIILKAAVRRGLASSPGIQNLTPGFELDWLARTLRKDRFADEKHLGGNSHYGNQPDDWRIISNEETEITSNTKMQPKGAELSQSLSTRRSAQEILIARKEFGHLAGWCGFAYDEAKCLSEAIIVTMNAFNSSFINEFWGRRPWESKLEGSWKWQLSVRHGGLEQKICLQLHKDTEGWRVERSEIDAALSLWLSSINEDYQKNKMSRKDVTERRSQHGTRNANRLSDSDKDSGSQPSIPTTIQGKRSLGENTSDLKKDFEWWVPRDLLHTFDSDMSDPELLDYGNSEAILHQANNKVTRNPDWDQKNDCTKLLTVAFRGSPKLLCAQDLFSAFIRAVAKILKDSAEWGVDELQPETSSSNGDWRNFKLRNNMLSQMAQDIHATGLGSLGDIFASIVAPLSQQQKLPRVDKVVEWAQEHADIFARLKDWERMQEALEFISMVGEAPSVVARVEGILMDHLRRVILIKEFQQEQKYDSSMLTTRSLARLCEMLTYNLERIRHYRQNVTGSFPADLIRLFDQSDCEGGRQTLLPLTMLVGGFQPKAQYPQSFNVTEEHYNSFEKRPNKWQEGHRRIPQDYINARDILDRTPAHYVAGSDDTLISTLKMSGANLEVQDLLMWTPLHYACWNGAEKQTQYLIDANVGLDHRTRDGATPLHYAVFKGNTHNVNGLICAGASIDARDFEGSAPIHLAAYGGHIDILRILLRGNASRNLRDHFGRTALHQASLSGKQDVVKLLLESEDIDLEVMDDVGQTPLSLATRMGYLDCAKRIIERGGNIESKDAQGKTPLHLAAGSGHVVCVQYLLETRADAGSTDFIGEIPLHHATRSGKSEIVEILLDHKSDVNSIAQRDGWTPLMIAAECGHLEMLGLLVERGADPQLRDPRGETALCYAVMGNVPAAVSILVNLGADRETAGSDGMTPLMTAAFWGRFDAAQQLLHDGAHLDSKDGEGRTALDIARKHHQERIIGLFLSATITNNIEEFAGYD